MNTLLKDRVRETLAARKECDHLLTVAEQKVSAQTKLLKQLKEVNDNRQKEIQDKIDANWENWEIKKRWSKEERTTNTATTTNRYSRTEN